MTERTPERRSQIDHDAMFVIVAHITRDDISHSKFDRGDTLGVRGTDILKLYKRALSLLRDRAELTDFDGVFKRHVSAFNIDPP